MAVTRTRPLVVVLRALKLGDLLTAVPALRAIRRHFPRHHVAVAAPAWLEGLVYLAGVADEVVDTRHLAPLDERLHGAYLAVNLHGCGPQSSELLARTRPCNLIAFSHPEVAATAGGPAWSSGEHEVRRWCRLLEGSGVPADPTDLRLRVPAAEPAEGTPGAVLLHPGASSQARRWPADRWASLARRLSADGLRVVVTGGPDEMGLGKTIADLAGRPAPRVAAGRTSLMELCASVARARLVVTGDTGVAHVASAFTTPSVVLFGPEAPSRWGPPSDGPHTALWAGRVGDPHGAEVDPGVLAITVDEVVEAAHARLFAARAPG